MKKIFLVVTIFFTACSFVPHYDTEFKNPVFNQLLQPLGKTVGYAYLTPTSVDFRTPLDKNKIDTQGVCNLIENQQNSITLKCRVEGWGRVYKQYYTFIIKDILLPNCLLIAQYSYSVPEEFPRQASYGTYCTIPPNNMKSEAD